jgi:hypothetical protein
MSADVSKWKGNLESLHELNDTQGIIIMPTRIGKW